MATAQNRRRHFFINKPLQIRYMFSVGIPIFVICSIALVGFYLGIWGKVLSSFSDEQICYDLLTAARMVEYEQARHPATASPSSDLSVLSVFKETEKLSQRQREVFKNILDETNRSLFWKLLLLLFLISWGTIYISHKTAGPLYRLSKAFEEIEKGNYRTRVFLRKGDEGHPVAKELNEALTSTDRLLSDIKNATRDSDPAHAVAQIKEKLASVQTSSDA